MSSELGNVSLGSRARELWDARANATPVRPDDYWTGLSIEQGQELFAELGAALEASGSAHVGAKIGQPDPETAAKLGIDGPVVAKTYANALLQDGGTLSLSELISPMFELEIGIRIDGSDRAPVPCVEIVDSRFNWDVAVGGQLIGDFASSGRLLFGSPAGGDLPATVRAKATCDGTVVAEGTRELSEALAVLPKLESSLPESPPGGEQLVASGTLNQPAPLTAGEWVFDFGELGAVELTVTP